MLQNGQSGKERKKFIGEATILDLGGGGAIQTENFCGEYRHGDACRDFMSIQVGGLSLSFHQTFDVTSLSLEMAPDPVQNLFRSSAENDPRASFVLGFGGAEHLFFDDGRP
ncbi:MAG: hypothetical protein HQL51_01285 [Magnetococcales bacterium]|nr:hypothetical protein [Magnetococcales bacterium]